MRSTLFALPALAASVLGKEFLVTWRHELSSGKTALEVQGTDKSMIAESCSSKIGALDFSDLDERGDGTFSVGGKKYEVLSQPESGPVCTRIYNGDIAVIECTGVDYDLPAGAATSAEDCFSHDDNKVAFRSLRARSADLAGASKPAERPEMPAFHSRILGSRQTTCISNTDLKLVGDGDPHQNYLHKQISETNTCGSADTCGAAAIKTESFTIGFSGGGNNKWISGGFDVSKSWTTGNSYPCNGKTGETVCIWYNTAHTAYTVRATTTSACYTQNNGKAGDPYVLKSPNNNNRGGGYYCVVGTCRAIGDEYWDNTGRAGGP